MSTPDPATTDWVPLHSLGQQLGPQIPAPVQNGKWLTGAGGAVVWADAPAAPLPARLAADSMPYVANLNLVLENGWSACDPTTIGNPLNIYGMVQTQILTTNNARQVAYEYGGDRRWTRRRTENVWSAWQMDPISTPDIYYVEGTSDFTISSNNAAAPNIILSFPAIDFAALGSPMVMFEFYATRISGDNVNYELWVNGAKYTQWGFTGGQDRSSVIFRQRWQSGGSYQWDVRGWYTTGSGVLWASPPYSPYFFRAFRC